MSAIASEVLSLIRADISKIAPATAGDRVFKDECVYCFDSPFSDSGLFVNLQSYVGVSQQHLKFEKSPCRLFLFQKWEQVKKPEEEVKAEEEGEGESMKPISRLAIGIEGGFRLDESKYDIVKRHELCLVDNSGEVQQRIELPNLSIPEYVSKCCQAIIDHAGARVQMQVSSWEATDERPVSKYAGTLVQLDNGKKIPSDPKQWACEDSGMKENLWLNLSTGYIGSGRANWDGTGGSGAALKREFHGRRMRIDPFLFFVARSFSRCS